MRGCPFIFCCSDAFENLSNCPLSIVVRRNHFVHYSLRPWWVNSPWPSICSSHADPRGWTGWQKHEKKKSLGNKPFPPPEWPTSGMDKGGGRRNNYQSNSKSRRGWCEERLICHGREVFMAFASLFHPSAASPEASLAVRRQMAESQPAQRMTINVWQSVSKGTSEWIRK